MDDTHQIHTLIGRRRRRRRHRSIRRRRQHQTIPNIFERFFCSFKVIFIIVIHQSEPCLD